MSDEKPTMIEYVTPAPKKPSEFAGLFRVMGIILFPLIFLIGFLFFVRGICDLLENLFGRDWQIDSFGAVVSLLIGAAILTFTMRWFWQAIRKRPNSKDSQNR